MNLSICPLTLALAACGLLSGLAAEDSPSAPAVNPAVQIGMGAKVFAENCSRCHVAPDPASRDSRVWRTLSLHMRLFADISRAEQQQVRAFLQAQNTPKKD